jgi:hypothetical protein
MWKRMLLMVCLLALLLLGGFGVCWIKPCHRINEESYASIERGMTLEEVQVLLRSPGRKPFGIGLIFRHVDEYEAPPLEWRTRDYSIYVGFQDGTVRWTGLSRYYYLEDPEESVLSRVRRWLGIFVGDAW